MESFSEKLKKFFSSEESLQRIPIYLFLICVLFAALFFRLGKTNLYLKEIAANGTNVIEVETKDNDNDYESVVDVYIDGTTKTLADYVPVFDEITKDKPTTQQSTETTTKAKETTSKDKATTQTKQQTTANNNKLGKTTYILNTSSKKIHLPTCSFVDRTKDENKKTVQLTAEELQEYLNNGYTFCKTCGKDLI